MCEDVELSPPLDALKTMLWPRQATHYFAQLRQHRFALSAPICEDVGLPPPLDALKTML